jgi:hypothetical protein
MTAKPKSKPAKETNPFVLGAEVYRTGMPLALGKIVKVTKTLLTVQWDTGMQALYGRHGEGFHGRPDADGEAITFTKSGKKLEDVWGSKDEPEIGIPTEGIRQRIAEERARKNAAKEERARQQAAIEADPAYVKRQADLAKYAELLKGIGHVENGWNNQSDFRIEIDGIKPEQMERLVAALRENLLGRVKP